MSAKREHELRCFCSGEPLLATYGIGKDGLLFVHVRIWKQRRIFGELVIQGGLVKMRCRNCFRWHRVLIRDNNAQLSEESEPETFSVTA